MSMPREYMQGLILEMVLKLKPESADINLNPCTHSDPQFIIFTRKNDLIPWI